MNVTFRYPAENGHVFTREEAETAIGKPLLDRVGDDGVRVGTVRAAWVEHGDLVMTVEIDNSAVQYDLASHSINAVSLVPKPRVVP